MGGGFRGFGQCPKENVFFSLTPSLISPHYNDGVFLPITPLRQDSHLLDITQIKRTDHLSLLSLLYTLHRSCVKSLRTHCQTSQRGLQAPTSYSARLHSVCMNRGSNLSTLHLVCAMCMSRGSRSSASPSPRVLC